MKDKIVIRRGVWVLLVPFVLSGCGGSTNDGTASDAMLDPSISQLGTIPTTMVMYLQRDDLVIDYSGSLTDPEQELAVAFLDLADGFFGYNHVP